MKTNGIKNILVPTDFSDCARTAEKIGLKLAKRTNARLHYLHMSTTPVHWISLQEEMENLYPDFRETADEAETQLDKLVDQAREQGIDASKFLSFGKVHRGIEDRIIQSDIDLVVMGSHGVSGWKELFIGSNAQKVVRSTEVPVLVVKPGHEKIHFGDIAFGFAIDEKVIKPFARILDFAKTLGSKVHIFYINTPFNFLDSGYLKTMMGQFALHYPNYIASTNVYNHHDLEEGLVKFCHTKGANILGMFTHGKKGLARVFSRSITESIINHADIPVLSLNLKL